MKRHLISTVVISAVLLLVALPVHAGDEFDTAVSRLSDRIGHRPLRIPFLGAILFFTPARSTHLRLATFEDVHTRLSLADLEASVQGTLGPEWHPFVRVQSKRDGENTLIYARAVNGQMRLMVITSETEEVTLVEMDVPKNLQASWLSDTKREAHHPMNGDGDGA